MADATPDDADRRAAEVWAQLGGPGYGDLDAPIIAAAIREAVAAKQEWCAVQADLVAANYRESAVLHGADDLHACYRSRASGADAVARRIREAGADLAEPA